eukprot:TRINITY_DN28144_c0_g1_i1.p1 TRINITY_DN28144_c0_g1~~TRINITY_DN28144_c0_g1_i1.p1  ORF type:complete len:297 (-),score=75.05 TRINITY_DN28144_c0_g1_i1:388-1278(-)
MSTDNQLASLTTELRQLFQASRAICVEKIPEQIIAERDIPPVTSLLTHLDDNYHALKSIKDPALRAQVKKLIDDNRKVYGILEARKKALFAARDAARVNVYANRRDSFEEDGEAGAGSEEGDRLLARQQQAQDQALLVREAEEKDRQLREALELERVENIKEIERDTAELEDMMRSMGEMVQEQGVHLDQIERNVASTVAHTDGGVKELGKAAKYGAMAWPIIGAAVGALLGPAGVAAGVQGGLALGGLTAGGAGVGYLGGRALKKKQNSNVDSKVDEALYGDGREDKDKKGKNRL